MSRFLRLLSRLAVIAGLVLQTRPSSAADPGPNDGQTTKRPVPDYDGRGETPTTTTDVLLWIPRVVAAPFYFVTEYVIRRPIGALVTAVERSEAAQRFLYVLTIGPKRNIGFSPTFYFDDGRLPAAGAYLWWDDVGAKQNHVRGYFATWGEPLITGTLSDRWEIDPSTAASLRVAYTHRTDNLFYGLGPDPTSRTESRFETSTIEGGPTFERRFFSAQAGVRDVRYGDGACCGTPKLLDRVRKGQLPAPPRLLDGGYTSVFQSATVFVDSRSALSRLGGRLAVTGTPSFDVSERPGQSWLRYESTAVGSWDVTGTARLLSLGVTAMFVDPILGGSRGIPFTELVTLGGAGPMRGFLTGRLVGRSAAVATLDYQWPIWSFLDGTMQAALGNAFGAGLEDFALEKLRLSAVFGLRSNSSRDHVFELLTGFGTETIEQGMRATAFRLAFGATRGF